ncbi:Gypsy retrotransposon integrase-like protein 1 [Marasmius crinis-equi]|uniref:Gypsy retrotransposon integrase-like protein 1 n=1 Tax=Marasmius crinis-equi TaxID=585013 RepID=A0ABR3G272_9AGAR
MSLRAQNGNAEPGPSKKRRLPGACDTCKDYDAHPEFYAFKCRKGKVNFWKKARFLGDSGEKPNGQCTNCTNSGIECTHVELTKNLGSAKGYVENLENRLEKMELLLKKLLPGVDVSNELDPEPTEVPHEEESIPRNDLEDVATKLEKLSLKTPYSRYYGKASDLFLVETALQHKERHTGQEIPVFNAKHAKQYWDPEPSHALKEVIPTYDFPEEDLMHELIDLYFTQYNAHLPVLHRPTFERSVKQGEHLHDHEFGAVLLLVCALGARFTSDPRTVAEDESTDSRGWKYVRQVPLVKVPRGKPTLYEIQQYALAVPWIKSCTYGFSAWSLCGFALRLAQDVGAHRRVNRSPNAQDELWKRAFFVLLYHERTVGAFMGRQPIIRDDEYNTEPPIIVDDEFWECTDPKMNMKQPAGKPSSVAFFVQLIKLTDIMSYAQRTVYTLRKPNTVTGKSNEQSDQQLIADLDSAMNSWLDSIPDYLKWDPKRPKDLFFEQSAMLWISFYNLQSFIHKPFIPTPQRPSSLSFPSLTICTTSSRALSHIARVLVAKDVILPLAHAVTCFFTGGVVLLLNTWTGKRSGVTGNVDRDQADVQAILDLMSHWENQWAHAGMFRELLEGIAKVSHVPMYGQKRRRSAENLREEARKPSTTSTKDRTVAGSRRVSRANGGGSSSSSSIGSSSPEISSLGTPSSLSSMSSFSFSPELPGLVGDFSTPSSSSSGNSPPYVPLSNPFLPESGTDSYSGSMPSTYSQQAELDTLLASLPAMSDPAMTIWSSMPFGNEMQDWAPYLSSFGQVDQTTPVYSNEIDNSNVHQLW